MARIRSVHPDICTNETLAELSAEVERTFVRLWTYCDDEGRAKDNPKLLKAALYPLDDRMTAVKVNSDLEVLAQHGLIVRYEADGAQYLHVPSFAKWQHPNRKVDSKLPAPPNTATTPPTHSHSSESSVSRPPHVPPVVVVGDVVGEGDVAPPAEPYEAQFDEAWKNYPRKERRKEALKAFQARVRTGCDPGQLSLAVLNYANSRRGEDPEYTMLGATFFSANDRWQDWLVPRSKSRALGLSKNQQAIANRRRTAGVRPFSTVDAIDVEAT